LNQPRVSIIGAGFTGFAAAHALAHSLSGLGSILLRVVSGILHR